MARSPWLAWVAIVLVCMSFLMGCGALQPRTAHEGSRPVAGANRDDLKAHGGDDARAALFVIGCVFFVVIVVVDLIILPCTIPCDRPFCCTQEVIVVCFH